MTTQTAAEILTNEYGLSEDDAREALERIGYSQLLDACARAMKQYMERAWTDPAHPDGPCADLRAAIAKATNG